MRLFASNTCNKLHTNVKQQKEKKHSQMNLYGKLIDLKITKASFLLLLNQIGCNTN